MGKKKAVKAPKVPGKLFIVHDEVDDFYSCYTEEELKDGRSAPDEGATVFEFVPTGRSGKVVIEARVE